MGAFMNSNKENRVKTATNNKCLRSCVRSPTMGTDSIKYEVNKLPMVWMINSFGF